MVAHRRVLTSLLLAVAGLGLTMEASGAVPTTRRVAELRELLPGRLIVKYRDSVASSVSCRLERNEGLATAVAAGGEAFEALHRRHGVRSARALFRSAEEELAAFPGAECPTTAALRAYHRSKLADARVGFTARSARARPDAALPDLHHVYLLELPAAGDPRGAAAGFSGDPNVEYAHPDYLFAIDLEPSDPFYRSAGSWGQPYDDLWGLKRDQLDLAPAWDLTQGEGIVVAIVDTGVDYEHEDLAANIWRNPREIAGNGVDDDRNGFVDDVRGWDFTTCVEFGVDRCRLPKPPDNDPRDDHLHGTHVAGTVAAVADNDRGIVGVAPRARIMAVKGLNGRGQGVTSDLAPALVYAAANGADVVNNSWGCGFCPSVPVYEEALKLADALGAVVVFAAGNAGRDSRVRSPHNLRHPKPIVVAASDPEDRPAFFTNFGAAVDVAAPGGAGEFGGEANILSLRKDGVCKGCRRVSLGRQYMRLQGTSMAAPHASGLAALVLARRADMSADQVRQVLRASSDDVQEPGFDLLSGAGRLNAPRALAIGSPLEAEIRSPAHLSAPRRGRLTVRGTAAGPGFASYELFVSDEESIDWLKIGAGRGGATRNGVLGGVGKSQLGPGWNLLRLVATAEDGRRYEDVISIANQPSRGRRIGAVLDGLAQAPHVSGRRVVWHQIDEPIREQTGHVYLYDLAKKSLLRLTESPVRRAEPRISGERIVWSGEIDDGNAHRMFTCVYDPAQGGCPAELLGSGGRPVVSGDRVAYGGRNGVFIRDLATDTRRQLAGKPGNLEIDGDLVAWTDRAGGGSGEAVYLYDWSTGTSRRLTDYYYNLMDMDLSQKTITYLTLEPRVGTVLRVYDLEKETERIQREGFPRVFEVDLSGGRVVWPELSDVKVLDLTSDRQHGAVIHPLVVRASPAISGNGLVWLEVRDFEYGAGDLYFAELRD